MIQPYIKKLVLLFFLLASVLSLPAQDLVVTHEGDSLNAKITRIKAGYLYINYRVGKKIVNTILPPDSVSFYQYDFYNFSDVPRNKVVMREDISNWRIALNGGWSWRVAPTDPSLSSFEKEYIDGLKSGHHVGAEVNYFFTNRIGVGLNYNAHLSSNSIYASAQFPSGIIKNGLLSDDILINYIGPSFNLRFMSKKSTNVLCMDASIGYSDYRDKFNFVGDTIIHIKITGYTVGINYNISYDFGITKHLALGAGISLRVAALSTLKITENGHTRTETLPPDSYESLARADILLGIRFR
jgi:hypothetical protein